MSYQKRTKREEENERKVPFPIVQGYKYRATHSFKEWSRAEKVWTVIGVVGIVYVIVLVATGVFAFGGR